MFGCCFGIFHFIPVTASGGFRAVEAVVQEQKCKVKVILNHILADRRFIIGSCYLYLDKLK
jgi:hypothetical protein